jgi:hypothetical protein
MRAGEKKILNKIVKFTDTMLDYFKLDFNEWLKASRGAELKDDQKKYLLKVILPLLKNEQ